MTIDLQKKVSLAKDIILKETKKQNITVTQARIVFVLDHSRSMSKLYNDGTVQNTLERIFPLAMHFDDNGEMEFYLFDTLFKELDSITNDNLEHYTSDVIFPKKGKYGATCYAPIINEITKRYGIDDKSLIPTFVVFITDGNNSDKAAAKEALSKASHYNIFWKFVGIGNEKFDFLERLDNMSGRFIDNANFIKIENLNLIKDTSLYEMLLTEFSDWCELCRNHNMI